MAKRVARPKEERIHRSSGNVFTDLGFPPEEAAHLLIRSDLLIQIERLLKERGLTQAKAAKLLGVSQPRISDLVRGRIEFVQHRYPRGYAGPPRRFGDAPIEAVAAERDLPGGVTAEPGAYGQCYLSWHVRL